jgi:hypothetical protein
MIGLSRDFIGGRSRMSGPETEVERCDRHGSLISTRPLPLQRTGGRTRNPIRWLWLAWRYGWSHPDEDLLGVIDAAGDALRAQIASAQAVLFGPARAKIDAIEKELEQELCREVPNLAAMLGLEAKINALYPPAIQRRRAWMLRDRFERVAPARAVAEYWASNPPEPGGPEVLAEEVRRCEAMVARTEAALVAARAATDAAAAAAAQERYDRAIAERDVARAQVEVDRSRRAMAAATDAARAAAAGTQEVRDAAQAALDAARRAHGTALDALDAAEELLIQRGGALPPSAGSAIDADAQTLLGYIHSSYMMSIGREKAVRDLMRWLIMRFWSANIIAVLVLMVVFVLFKALPGTDFMPLGNLVVGLFFIAAVGRIGATMSVVQRLQTAISGNILAGDSFLELARLRTGKNQINLALFAGAVFALLLYAIFATGAPAMLGFENGLFPQMETRTVATPGASAPATAAAASAEPKPAAATPAATTTPAPVPGGNAAAGAPGNAVAAADGNSVAGNAAAAATPPAGNSAAPAAPATANSLAPAAPAAPAVRKETGAETQPAARRSFWDRLFDSAPSQCKANQPCDPFTQLAEALGFPTRMDFFKLLLWAFLAGFAERLVPDVLDAITRRTRANTNVAAEAHRNRAEAEATAPPPPAPEPSPAPAPAPSPSRPAAHAGGDPGNGQGGEGGSRRPRARRQPG